MFFGVLIVYFSLNEKVAAGNMTGNFAVLCPANPKNPPTNIGGEVIRRCSSKGVFLQTFLMEMTVTFIFVSVICNVKFLNDPGSTVATGFAVGATLTGMIIVSAGMTGGCINCAVGIV